MYNASETYIATSKQAVRFAQQIRGSISKGGQIYTFTGSDVIKNSFEITNQICSSTQIELGGVYAGQLNITFSPAFAADAGRGTWAGAVVNIELALITENGAEYIPAPSYVFTVDSATWSAEGLQILGYDNMLKFDRSFTADTSSGTAYDWLTYICTNCGVQLGMTAEEVQELPNGTYNLALYSDNGLLTFRDVLRELATACGCFATINRTGALVLRQLSAGEATDSITASHRIAGATFSDFETYYTGLYITDSETNTAEYYTAAGVADDGLTLSIGANPFLQYGTAGVKAQMRQNVINSLAGFRATPARVSLLSAAQYDLGDLLQYPGGIGAGAVACIMYYSITADTLQAEGYGENPALATAQSKTSKDISGLVSATSGQTVEYYTYTNIRAVEVSDGEEETAAAFRFGTKTDTTVTLWHEFKINIELEDEETPGVVKVHYYLNGIEENYQPEQIITASGVYTLDYNYYLRDISGGAVNTWTATIETTGASASVDIGGVHVCLCGQGLVSNDTFLGYIDASDDITALTFAGINPAAFSETLTVEQIPDDVQTITEERQADTLQGIDLQTAENAPNVYFEYLIDYIAFTGELYTGEDLSGGGYNIL